jgi:hypothetical protein
MADLEEVRQDRGGVRLAAVVPAFGPTVKDGPRAARLRHWDLRLGQVPRRSRPPHPPGCGAGSGLPPAVGAGQHVWSLCHRSWFQSLTAVARTKGETEPLPASSRAAPTTVSVHRESTRASTSSTGSPANPATASDRAVDGTHFTHVGGGSRCQRSRPARPPPGPTRPASSPTSRPSSRAPAPPAVVQHAQRPSGLPPQLLGDPPARPAVRASTRSSRGIATCLRAAWPPD